MLWMDGSPPADPLRMANPETSAVMIVSRRGLADPIARAATKLVAYYSMGTHHMSRKVRSAHHMSNEICTQDILLTVAAVISL